MPRLLTAATGTSVLVTGSIVDAPATSYLRGTVLEDQLRPFTTDRLHTYPNPDVSGTLQDRVVRQDDGRLCFYYRIYDLTILRGTFAGIKYIEVTYEPGASPTEIEVDFRLDGLGETGPNVVQIAHVGSVSFNFDASEPVTPSALSRFMYILPTVPTVSEYTTGGAVRLLGTDWSVDIPGCFQPVLPKGRAKTPRPSKARGK